MTIYALFIRDSARPGPAKARAPVKIVGAPAVPWRGNRLKWTSLALPVFDSKSIVCRVVYEGLTLFDEAAPFSFFLLFLVDVYHRILDGIMATVEKSVRE